MINDHNKGEHTNPNWNQYRCITNERIVSFGSFKYTKIRILNTFRLQVVDIYSVPLMDAIKFFALRNPMK